MFFCLATGLCRNVFYRLRSRKFCDGLWAFVGRCHWIERVRLVMAVSLSSVDLFRAFCSYSQIPQGDQIGALRERVAQLEASKTSLSVDSVLARLRSIVAKTGRNFSKEEAFDCLIDLRAARTTEQHERLLHFQAVYEAMKYKISFPPDQFRRYLVAL